MRILFVCLGNICRSPTTEGVVRSIAAREFPELVLEVDSAGIADYHVGEPPDRAGRGGAAGRGFSARRATCTVNACERQASHLAPQDRRDHRIECLPRR